MKKLIILLLVASPCYVQARSNMVSSTQMENQMQKDMIVAQQKQDAARKAALAQTQYNNSLTSLTANYAADRASHSSQVNLMGQDLSNDDLAKYNLLGAGLLGVVISDSTKNTQGANLSYADLRYSCLMANKLNNPFLSNALFVSADLSYAYVSWGNFTNANFTKADLTGAHLEGADLTGAIFTDAIVSGATYDQYTKLPQSLNAVQLGTMIKVVS